MMLELFEELRLAVPALKKERAQGLDVPALKIERGQVPDSQHADLASNFLAPYPYEQSIMG